MMHDALLTWYDNNRRVLPWRALPGQQANPYHVYISEIFLQQTTVATVIDYFNRFIHHFPTFKALASASLHDVLVQFQGLGYYSRARNLHKTAQIIATDYKGTLPPDAKKLLALPGIGDYTAYAVLAIAFDQPYVPVDGNVIRVYARYFGLETPLPALKKEVQIQANKMGAGQRPGDFAQALMDLGSLVCKPKNPQCFVCPLQTNCAAFQHNKTASLPIKKPKSVQVKRYALAHLFSDETAVYICHNQNDALLNNLWGTPLVDLQSSKQIQAYSEYPVVYHVFTHFHLTVFIYHRSLKQLPKKWQKIGQIIKKTELPAYPISTLMKKIFQMADKCGQS